MLIDTHSHIYASEFNEDRPDMLRNAAAAGIETILMPAIDTDTHDAMLALEAFSLSAPGLPRCLSMMGLHPVSVNADYQQELDQVRRFLEQRSFIAIGETGIDLYWDQTYRTQQIAAFEQQIEWALEYGLPLVIHSRASTDLCIDIVSGYIARGLKGVFHCFGGSLEEARTITEMGFYLGIGGVLTFKKSGLDQVLKELDLKYILLETDAPYLAPTPYRGKRNEPAYLKLVAQKLADTKEMPLESLAAICTENAKKLFAL
ncbi:TatD family hydrolase [Niabella terrae]